MTTRPKYRGVTWRPLRQMYQVRLKFGDQPRMSFGYYRDAAFAARLYDGLAKELWGGDATLNFDGVLPTGVTRVDIWNMLHEKGLR